mgnify:FL=1
MIKLVGIPRDAINKVWSKVENDIIAALDRSGNWANSTYFYDRCKEGKYQLWVLWDKDEPTDVKKYYGIVVTEIIQRQLQKCCLIKIMTGHHREKWQHLLKDIEVWAALNNCDKMELMARPGWERILKNFKYSKSHVLLEKPLKKQKENK